MQRIRPGGLEIQHPSMDTSSNVLRMTSILHRCANCQHMSVIPENQTVCWIWPFRQTPGMVASVDTLQPVSDHLPILLKTNAFGRPGADNQYAEQNEERWDFRNANLEALHRTLLSVNWEEIFDVEEDINGLWKKWKSAFFRCMEQTISKRKPRTNKPQTNPWFNSFLAGMIRRRNRLFRCACRSNSEEMWVRYRESRNMVTSAIRSTKRRYYMHKAELLMKPDCPSSKWWKAAKELTGQAVDVKGVPPFQDTKGAFVYDEKGKLPC